MCALVNAHVEIRSVPELLIGLCKCAGAHTLAGVAYSEDSVRPTVRNALRLLPPSAAQSLDAGTECCCFGNSFHCSGL